MCKSNVKSLKSEVKPLNLVGLYFSYTRFLGVEVVASVSPIHAPISSNAMKAATIGIAIIHSRNEAVEIGSKKNKV